MHRARDSVKASASKIADSTGASTLFVAQGIAVAVMLTLISLGSWRYVVSREEPPVEEEPATVSAGG